jgi:hypothetical protein
VSGLEIGGGSWAGRTWPMIIRVYWPVEERDWAVPAKRSHADTNMMDAPNTLCRVSFVRTRFHYDKE